MVAAATTVALAAGCGSDGSSGGGAQKVSAEEMKKLPRATTHATIEEAPEDPKPSETTDGKVVHPNKEVAIHDEPNGDPIAVLPPHQLGGPTWVPVVESSEEWRRILLPSRPNKASGWIDTETNDLDSATSSSVVKVDVSSRKVSLQRDGKPAGTWTAAVGKEKTPTPAGRTFMMALLEPQNPTYSPLIMPLGTHSNTHETYGGGPGTVGFHGWKDESVFGNAVTDGCVRVPGNGLKALSEVPLGSLVMITD